MALNSNNGEMTRSALTASKSAAEIKHRTPEEALGLPKSGGLVGPGLIATGITLVALAALTAGPYFFSSKPANTPAAAAPEAAPANVTTGPTPSEAGKLPASAATAPQAKGTTPKGKDILDVLGENGTKKANPKVNPLDKKDDDILKEIK